MTACRFLLVSDCNTRGTRPWLIKCLDSLVYAANMLLHVYCRFVLSGNKSRLFIAVIQRRSGPEIAESKWVILTLTLIAKEKKKWQNQWVDRQNMIQGIHFLYWIGLRPWGQNPGNWNGVLIGRSLSLVIQIWFMPQQHSKNMLRWLIIA